MPETPLRIAFTLVIGLIFVSNEYKTIRPTVRLRAHSIQQEGSERHSNLSLYKHWKPNIESKSVELWNGT